MRFDGGYAGTLQERNGVESIPVGYTHMEDLGAWENFENAAARLVGPQFHHGPVFEDGEAFKWLEAAAWNLGHHPSTDLTARWRRVAELAERAQDEDGYLSTFNQVSGARGRYVWMSDDHEVFNQATLIDAAVAGHRILGDERLLAVAMRSADHLVATFGPGKREELCGHPLIEMALVELYRETGRQDYLDLARWYVDFRGHQTIHDYTHQGWTSTYFSDRIPLRHTKYLEGHAVRALHLAARATDVAIECGDFELLEHLEELWANTVAAKMYVNGSMGSRWEGESFGDPYELPNDRAYGETCAAISCMQWSWRMLLATGDARYADLMDHQLWNAVLPGVSLNGTEFFYVNALQVRGEALTTDARMPAAGRRPWFGCSCCPTNLMRLLAVLNNYLATVSDDGIQLHQLYAADLTTEFGRLSVASDYPFDGNVTVTVDADQGEPFEIAVRIPSWANGSLLSVNGEPRAITAGEYFRETRRWSVGDIIRLVLPFAPRWATPDPRNDNARGCLALFHGPLLYAVEQCDLPLDACVDDLILTSDEVEIVDDRFQDLQLLRIAARDRRTGERFSSRCVPYFAWANRRVGAMRVWLPANA